MKFSLLLRYILVLSSIVWLSSCAGMDYVKQKYQGYPAIEFTAKDGSTYRIVDNRADARLLIGPSALGSASQGFMQGFARGSGLGTTPPVVFRDAAEEYLASTDRRCETRDVTLVVEPYFEIRYKCRAQRSRMRL